MAHFGVFSKVAFASKVPVLLKATSDDPNPTPGYLYEEIAKITNESLEHCDNLASFLLGRVNKSSHHVKLKALLVIKAVLEKGNPEFRHGLSRQADPIRAAKSFTGPPDAIYGDHPFIEIRKAASMVLELLFNVDRSGSQRESNPSEGAGLRQMEGFGNTVAPSDNSLTSTLKKFASNIPSVFLGKSSETPSESSYQNFSNQDRATYNTPSESITSVFQTNRTSVQDYPRAQHSWDGLGNGSSTNSNLDTTTDSSLGQVNWRNIGMERSYEKAPEDQSFEQLKTHGRNSSLQESKIVDEFTSPGGVRVQHSREEVEQFLKRCSTLDVAQIVSFLRKKLDSSNAQVQLLLLALNPHVKAPDGPNPSPRIAPVANKQEDLSSWIGQEALALPSSGFHPGEPSQEASIVDLIQDEKAGPMSGMFSGLKLKETECTVNSVENKRAGSLETGLTCTDGNVALPVTTKSSSVTSLDPFDTYFPHSGTSDSGKTSSVPNTSVQAECNPSLNLLDLDPFANAGESSSVPKSNPSTTSLVGPADGLSLGTPLVPSTEALLTQPLSNWPASSSYAGGKAPSVSPSISNTSGVTEMDLLNLSSFPNVGPTQSSNRGSNSVINLPPSHHVQGVGNPQQMPYRYGSPVHRVQMGAFQAPYANQQYQRVPTGFPSQTAPQNVTPIRLPSQPRSNFDFISKKADAFDFVKDAIAESKKKK